MTDIIVSATILYNIAPASRAYFASRHTSSRNVDDFYIIECRAEKLVLLSNAIFTFMTAVEVAAIMSNGLSYTLIVRRHTLPLAGLEFPAIAFIYLL